MKACDAPQPTEHELQCAFFERVRRSFKRYPDLEYMRAFPNGGLRHPAVAKKMKAEGVAPGPLDVMLPTKSGPYSGLWLEFKVPGKKMTPDQVDYSAYLQSQGFLVKTVFSSEEAWKETLHYLHWKGAD